MLGTVPGKRGLEIMGAYVSAFADFVFHGEKVGGGGLVDGQTSARFKEVEVVRFEDGKVE